MNESPAGNVTETSKYQEKTGAGSGTPLTRRKSRRLRSRIAARKRDPWHADPDTSPIFPRSARSRKLQPCLGLTAFFLFYGLVPIFGGDGLGLVGADEPRYAQVAREMLARRDYVTPVLWAHPWLEKPALYYWRAMFAFRGIWRARLVGRLPSASFAFMLVVLIYLHIRRLPQRRATGRGADHRILRRDSQLRARRFYRHAAGGAFLHRHARLVRVV